MYNFCNAKSSSLVRKREKGRHHEWALRKVAFKNSPSALPKKRTIFTSRDEYDVRTAKKYIQYYYYYVF